MMADIGEREHSCPKENRSHSYEAVDLSTVISPMMRRLRVSMTKYCCSILKVLILLAVFQHQLSVAGPGSYLLCVLKLKVALLALHTK